MNEKQLIDSLDALSDIAKEVKNEYNIESNKILILGKEVGLRLAVKKLQLAKSEINMRGKEFSLVVINQVIDKLNNTIIEINDYKDERD